MEQDIVSAGYDNVYGGRSRSPTLRHLWHEHAEGLDFPEDFGHISFTTLPELRRMTAEVRLVAGDTLVDLGCGMAGPVLWVARETGARLIGVDASRVAIDQAGERAVQLGLAEQARFVVSTFADTGLASGSTAGIMSEDAIQYAPDKRAVVAEAARILRSGGRLVCTIFELDPERAAGLPVLGADPVDDYRPLLAEAGFRVDVYDEISGWPEPVTATYSALLNARRALTEEMGEAAVGALFLELSLTLERQPYRRRVLVAAMRE